MKVETLERARRKVNGGRSWCGLREREREREREKDEILRALEGFEGC